MIARSCFCPYTDKDYATIAAKALDIAKKAEKINLHLLRLDFICPDALCTAHLLVEEGLSLLADLQELTQSLVCGFKPNLIASCPTDAYFTVIRSQAETSYLLNTFELLSNLNLNNEQLKCSFIKTIRKTNNTMSRVLLQLRSLNGYLDNEGGM